MFSARHAANCQDKFYNKILISLLFSVPTTAFSNAILDKIKGNVGLEYELNKDKRQNKTDEKKYNNFTNLEFEDLDN